MKSFSLLLNKNAEVSSCSKDYVQVLYSGKRARRKERRTDTHMRFKFLSHGNDAEQKPELVTRVGWMGGIPPATRVSEI